MRREQLALAQTPQLCLHRGAVCTQQLSPSQGPASDLCYPSASDKQEPDIPGGSVSSSIQWANDFIRFIHMCCDVGKVMKELQLGQSLAPAGP